MLLCVHTIIIRIDKNILIIFYEIVFIDLTDFVLIINVLKN